MIHEPGIYIKEVRHAWLATEPEFKEKEPLVKSYHVMQRWENNYMKSFASVVTSCGGDVLKVGFGMGISASYIQRSKNIKSHTGVFTYFTDEAKEISKQHMKELTDSRFKNIAFRLCKVHPSKTCEYWNIGLHRTSIIKKT